MPGAPTASTTSGTLRRSRLLQHAVRHGGAKTYEEYSRLVNDDSARKTTLRGLLRFRFAEGDGIPLEDVEPAAGEIVKRFFDRRNVARLARP